MRIPEPQPVFIGKQQQKHGKKALKRASRPKRCLSAEMGCPALSEGGGELRGLEPKQEQKQKGNRKEGGGGRHRAETREGPGEKDGSGEESSQHLGQDLSL